MEANSVVRLKLQMAKVQLSRAKLGLACASPEAVTLTVANGIPQAESIGAESGAVGLSEPREQMSAAGLGDLGLVPENA
jgi:hypothetical protein